MIFADTGYFLALLQPDDSLNASARRWSLAIEEPLLTSEFVLIEFADALSSPRGRVRVAPFLASLSSQHGLEIVPASSELFDLGLDLYARRPDKEWSLTDCISFALMEERGVSRALAFDYHFEQAGFEALLRREPQ